MDKRKVYILKHPDRRKETLRKWHIKRKSIRPWETHYFAAMQRCTNPKHQNYTRYGGKGIKFLMTKTDYEFMWNRDKAYLMSKPTIDRIDSNGNYEPSNCRFIEQSENSRRRRRLSFQDITEIRDMYSSGSFTYNSIGLMFNLDASGIGRIVRKEEYADIV